MNRQLVFLALAALLVCGGSFWPAQWGEARANLNGSTAAGPSGASLASSQAAGDEEITPPVLVKSVPPVYPEEARKAGAQGMVFLRTEIRIDGTIGPIAATKEVEGHPELTRAATDALKQFVFKPATKHGVPIAMTVELPIRFLLDGKKK